MKARALEQYLNEYLNAEAFHDYAPNGIQVEGRPEVRRIALGVTASAFGIPVPLVLYVFAFSCRKAALALSSLISRLTMSASMLGNGCCGSPLDSTSSCVVISEPGVGADGSCARMNCSAPSSVHFG